MVTLGDLISEVNRRLDDDEEREHYASALRDFATAVKQHSGKAFGNTVDHARGFLRKDDATSLREALKDSYDFLAPLLKDAANLGTTLIMLFAFSHNFHLPTSPSPVVPNIMYSLQYIRLLYPFAHILTPRHPFAHYIIRSHSIRLIYIRLYHIIRYTCIRA
jgi:hypothetical protein